MTRPLLTGGRTRRTRTAAAADAAGFVLLGVVVGFVAGWFA